MVCFQLFSGVARLLRQPMAAWCCPHQFSRRPILASDSARQLRLLHLNCQLSPDLISITSPSNFRLSLARVWGSQPSGLPFLVLRVTTADVSSSPHPPDSKNKEGYSPAAVPQHGGTHQAEEKMVAITSSGKSVTFRWICSRLSTRARTTPNEKSTRLRCTRSWCQLPGRAPHPAVPARWTRGNGSVAPGPCGQRAAAIMPRGRLYDLAAPALWQLQTWSCNLGIGGQAHRGRSTPQHHT